MTATTGIPAHMDKRIGSMTVSGPSLRVLMYTRTGCDAYCDRDFAWSDELHCDECTVADSTVVISVDGETFTRVCFHCAVDL